MEIDREFLYNKMPREALKGICDKKYKSIMELSQDQYRTYTYTHTIVKKLERLGLIILDKTQKKNIQMIITKKGIMVVDRLLQIEDIIR